MDPFNQTISEPQLGQAIVIGNRVIIVINNHFNEIINTCRALLIMGSLNTSAFYLEIKRISVKSPDY
jgi:hypothetical protein